MLENALKKHKGLSAWILSVHCVARLAAVAMMAIFSPGGNALSLSCPGPQLFSITAGHWTLACWP